jgi:hypothetical protein
VAVPRVAYVITSYTLPNQALRLASLLRRGSPGASIVVHHDDRWCSLDRAAMGALGVRLMDPPCHVAWGDASQLTMVLRCLEWLRAHTDFEWVVLLSGQDYPIRPVAAIEQSLAEADVAAFIETLPVDRPPLRRTIDDFSGRYHYQWWRVPDRIARVGPLAQKARPLARARELPNGMWVGVPALRSPFGPDLACHHGSDWFTLSRGAVEAVHRFLQERPAVLRYFRRTLIPTESLVQTVLANDDSLRLSGDNRRYLVFGGEDKPRPRVLRMEDLDALLDSRADFARKFDESLDAAVLDELDRRVHSGTA